MKKKNTEKPYFEYRINKNDNFMINLTGSKLCYSRSFLYQKVWFLVDTKDKVF